MPELDEDLVKELREQLDAEKKEREELIEELRAGRKAEPEGEPTGPERIRSYYKEKAKEKGGRGDG